jgi:translation initiation factor IF-2
VPIRIYALAKELKLDTKDLVDICARAGIPAKGSPLASLEDDEVAKLKAYLSGSSKPSSRSSAGAPIPPSSPPPPSKPRVLPRQPAQPAPPAPTPEVVEAEPVAPQVAAAPAESETISVAATADEGSTVAASSGAGPLTKKMGSKAPPPRPSTPDSPKSPFTRDDYIPSTSSGGKVKVIGGGRKKEGEKRRDDGEGAKGPRQRAPIIRVADMPNVKQPSPPPTAPEPKAQKPEIRLTKEVLRGSSKGKTPTAHVDDIAKAMSKTGATKHSALQDIAGKLLNKEAKPAKKKGKGVVDTEEFGAKGPAKGPVKPGLAGMASARANRHQARKIRSVDDVSDDDSGRRRRPRHRSRSKNVTDTAAPRKAKVQLALPCTVRSFSEAAGVASSQVQRTLMGLGMMATINQQVPNEYVDLLAMELGVELEFRKQETAEESMLAAIEDRDDDPASLAPRPPIVTFLGHVDHGKTSLLDRIIGIDVVSGEAGGITQHIRAYQVDKGDRKIAFVDTPGHEAFTEMRARGANVTDIAVLVIAADDGIMPQTEEAISHLKAAEVPIVVALNKIDLPGVDENRILQQLAAQDLLPSEWGGNVEVVRTSATIGTGVDDLLETLLTIADLHELTANPDRPATGTCLEAEQEAGRGVIAKLIVRNGTLNVGDVIVCGAAHGRVKAMYDTLHPNQRVKSAGPSTPVNVTGLDIAPEAGDSFNVLEDIAQAREIASLREHRGREGKLGGKTTKVSFEQFQDLLTSGKLGVVEEKITLNLIIRADVRGSIEALLKELGKLEHPEVQVKVLQASVGGITVADVTLANASDAVIIGFNVIPDEAARSLADQYGVEIRRYDIIYKVADDIKAMLSGKLKPEERIVELGRALVKQVFSISRVGAIAGCYVASGNIERGCRIRVNRDGRTIGDYALDSLRREKDDVKEVQRGMECGIRLAGFNDIKKDDVLEAYKIEEVARSL